MKKKNSSEKNPTASYLEDVKKKMEEHFKEDAVLAQAKIIKEKRGLKKKLVEGILTTYYETGMEGTTGLVLQDKEHITPNVNYDPNDSSKGPAFWHGYEGLYFLQDGDYLKVFENDKVIFEGELHKDKKAMADGGYQVSLMIKGVEKAEWYRWFKNELRAQLFCERKD